MKESTDLAVMKPLTAQIVFAPGGVEAILEKITQEVRSHVGDISTPSGRDAIKSLAYKVARSKTALDDMGKELVAEWKAKASAVDAERRTIRDRLDALKDEVRKPLTDWENAEKARVEGHEAAIAAIHALTVFTEPSPSSAAIHERRLKLGQMQGRDWQEFLRRGSEAETSADAALERMFVEAKKREDDAAELTRLRAEQAERERKEREERIAAEAAERARREAEEKAAAEAAAAADAARKEQERVEREKAEAIAKAEAAAAAAAEAARKEQERIEREKAQAEERARKAEADRKAAIAKAEADAKAAAEAAERRRLQAIEDERARVAAAEAAEKEAREKREADKQHRGKINREARDAMMALGISQEHAEAAVAAIAKGVIPHISIAY